ncbi:MAG: hypothetical protein ABIH25_05320 [Candidatus Woesearchaeota archaeon]
MGIRNARHKGRMHIKGRPKEVAKAEIMVMKHQDRKEDKTRRRRLFTFLDIIIIVAFGLAIYSVYISNYVNAIFFLIIGGSPLTYFIIRRMMKDKRK